MVLTRTLSVDSAVSLIGNHLFRKHFRVLEPCDEGQGTSGSGSARADGGLWTVSGMDRMDSRIFRASADI